MTRTDLPTARLIIHNHGGFHIAPGVARQSFTRCGSVYSCPADYDLTAITAEDLIRDNAIRNVGDHGQPIIWADDRTGDDSAEAALTAELRACGVDLVENEDGDLVLGTYTP